MTGPGRRALRWVAEVTQAAEVVVVRGLREGGSPWLLRCGHRDLVLRVGQPDEAASFATEVAGLRLATRAGIPVPGLIGYDEGAAAGGPLVLTGRVPGSSQIPPGIPIRPACKRWVPSLRGCTPSRWNHPPTCRCVIGPSRARTSLRCGAGRRSATCCAMPRS